MKFIKSMVGGRKKETEKDRIIKQLRESEERYRLIMEYSPLGVFHYDDKGVIKTFNKAFVKLLGSREELLKGLNMLELPDQGIVEAVKGTLKGLLTDYKGEYLSVTSGKKIPVRVLFAPLFDENNEVTGGVGLAEDISERIKAEKELKESEEKYREVLATIEDGYYEVDLNGKITACNRAAARMLGYETDQLIGISYITLCKDSGYLFKKFNEAFKTGEAQFSISADMYHKNGELLCVELSLSLTRDKDGRIIGFRGLGRDITERVLYEKQLRYLSFHDQLTGLYNRLYFENELARLNNSREYPISIIAIDVDDLKVVNDSSGHAAGDELLKACAGAVKNSLRNSDLLARHGGDEFVAILPGTDYTTCSEIVKRISMHIETLNHLKTSTPLSISIGFATAAAQENDLSKTLKEADDLMYRHKFSKDACSGSNN